MCMLVHVDVTSATVAVCHGLFSIVSPFPTPQVQSYKGSDTNQVPASESLIVGITSFGGIEMGAVMARQANVMSVPRGE